ncbi:hypothetical protein O181_125054 [Austropuccinia psidii MF-1]|uniref:Uncharacterized protein n=1 Tax=Austropuccinia psidii MF-1 TaxID=1389203 RepID=A0A9Q3KTB8_9BASI|nr:hypothetical protein [Austropuccinia psidii MF-1]
MIPPHSKDFGFPRDYSLQRETTISWKRGLEKREFEVVQSHNTWKDEPPYTFQNRSGNPTTLCSGFTPLRNQQISDQESPYFPIQDRNQQRKRIIGQEQDCFQPEAERVRSYEPEIAGPVARSTKKQQTVVNTSNAARSPIIRNDISTQMKQNVVIPESTISSDTLFLQFSQLLEQTKKDFERPHESISRLQEVCTLQTRTIQTVQVDYTELYKASEDT